jgi:hypothetical protein
MIKPKIPTLYEYGPIQISVRISDEPYEEGKYAPHLHIKAYHSTRRKINITPCKNELIEMEVPKKFKRSDLETFVSICGKDILERLRNFLDAERESPPEPLTYNSKVPFLGKYVPIRILPNTSTDNGYFNNGAVCLKAGLSGDEIRDAVLGLLGDMAYGFLKKRLDYYAKIMNVYYSSLEIDDGRRAWGSYNQDTKVIFMSRRILMMSKNVIDSLIVHELAHTKVFAHKKEFYDEILKVMPDYEEADKAFLGAANLLFEQGWI